MAEQAVGLRFEGEGNLIPFLEEARKTVNGLKDASGKASASIAADMRKVGEETKQANTQLNLASKLVVALAASAQQGLPALIKNLSDVADISETVTSSLSEADKSNFASVNAGLREVAKNQKIIVEDIDASKEARIDALVEAKNLTAEEANLLKQVTAVVDTFKKLEKVKLPVISSVPSGPDPGQAAAPPDALLENARQLREAYAQAANEAERIGETFGKNSAAFAQANATAESLKRELAASVAQGGALQQRVKATQADAEKIAKTAGINTKEFQASAQAAQEVRTEVEATQAALGEQGGTLGTVRQQYREALAAAQELAQTPGPEYDAALEEVARLKKLLDDTASSVRNLNPGDKVRAFTQLGNAIAGGAQAISGALIAFGGNNQALQETLFKFQSVLFAVQGAQTFLKDFGDSIQDIRRIMGLATAAQEANTVATELDVAAKGAQTTANATATTSTGVLTGAVRTLTAAILANPLIAIVAVAAAVGAALIALSDDVGFTKEEFEGLNAQLDETIRKRDLLRSAGKTLADLQAEAKAIGSQGTAQESRAAIEAKGIRDLADLEARRADQKLKLDVAALRVLELRKQLTEAINSLDGFAISGIKEELDEAQKLYQQAKEDVFQTNVDIVANAKGTANQIAQFDKDQKKESVDRAKQLAKETADIREQLAAQIEAIEKQLADKLRELETGRADPRAQLELQRQAADEELALLERNLRREIALQELRVKIGTEAFQALSEAQKKAAADAIIEDGGGELSTKQAEAFANTRLLIEEDFLRKRVDLQLEFDQVLADASGDARVKELAALDALLIEREKKLRDAGATEAEIAEDAARQVKAAEGRFASERLAIEERTQLSLLGAQLAAADGREKEERAIQEKILRVKLEFATRGLALIEDDGKAETAARIAAAKETIAGLEKELGNLKVDVKPFRLSDLFELDGAAADAFNRAAADVIGSTLDIFGELNAADQQRLDDQIAVTDQLIEDIQRRGDELQAQLEKDLQLNKEGLANNLDATLAAIEENKKAEAAALAEKKRIQAEQAKLAKQQVLIDSAVQASGLATGVANLIKTWSTVPFGIGLLSAFAQAAAIASFFVGLKGKLSAASQPQGLKTGTKSVERKGAPVGIDTVPAMLTEDEAVIPVEKNRKHRGLVGAIIDDDFSKLTPEQLRPILAQIDLEPLLAGTGVTVNEKEVSRMVSTNTSYRERVETAKAVDMEGVERRLDVLTAKVEAFRKQEGDAERTEERADGTRVIRIPGQTRIIRKA